MIEPLKHPKHWRPAIERLQQEGMSDADIRKRMEQWKKEDLKEVAALTAIEPREEHKLKVIAQINKEIEAGTFDFEKEIGRRPRRSDFASDLAFENAVNARRTYLASIKAAPPLPKEPESQQPAKEKEQSGKKLKDVIL